LRVSNDVHSGGEAMLELSILTHGGTQDCVGKSLGYPI
jgi:hypothetical protein